LATVRKAVVIAYYKETFVESFTFEDFKQECSRVSNISQANLDALPDALWKKLQQFLKGLCTEDQQVGFILTPSRFSLAFKISCEGVSNPQCSICLIDGVSISVIVFVCNI
jgi:hypothetical protein